MATWGAYLKSYVVAPTPTQDDKPVEKEKAPQPEIKPANPVIRPAVPVKDIVINKPVPEPPKPEPPKPDPPKPDPPVPPSNGRLAGLFGYGAPAPQPTTGVESNIPQMPKVANVVQQVAKAEPPRKEVDPPKPTPINPVPEIAQPKPGLIAGMFGYGSTPTEPKAEPKAEPKIDPKPLPPPAMPTVVKVPVVPPAAPPAPKTTAAPQPPAQPAGGVFASLFGYGKAEAKVEEEDKNQKTSDSGTSAGNTSNQPTETNAVRRAKMFGYSEKQAPVTINPLEALAQAELALTTLPKPVLNVQVPVPRSISELISAQSSATTASRNSLSSFTSSANSSLLSDEDVVPEYVLRAEEDARKRKALQVEKRVERIRSEQDEMVAELDRMRMEALKIRQENERIAQEEYEMDQYCRQMGLPDPKKLAMEAIKNAPPPQFAVKSSDSATSQKSPLKIDLDAPIRVVPKTAAAEKADLVRSRMRKEKERLARLAAEEAQRVKEEEEKKAEAARAEVTDDDSVYESEYFSDGEDEEEGPLGIERLNKEDEARRLEEEKLAERERLAEEKRTRKEEEEERRFQEGQRREDERLEKERLEDERRETERLENEKRENERREDERREDEKRENENREKAKRENERLEKETREKERLENEKFESDRRDIEKREKERLARVNSQREQAEKEKKAREEMEQIEEQRSLQQQRGPKKNQEEAQRSRNEPLATPQRPDPRRNQQQQRQVEEDDDDEDEDMSKEAQIRRAEKKIQLAFQGLAAEKESNTGQRKSIRFPIAIPPSQPRTDIRGGREPDIKRPSFTPAYPVASPIMSTAPKSNGFAAPKGNRDDARQANATGGAKVLPGLPSGPRGGLPAGPRGGRALPAVPKGSLPARNESQKSQTSQRSGGLPAGPRAGGLPSGPRVGLPTSGPRGAPRAINPRVRT